MGYFRNHLINFFRNPVIRNPKHKYASRLKDFIPYSILFFLFFVDAPIHLHDHPRFATIEIYNEPEYYMLPSEMESVNLISSYPFP
jgi:hypothetical protein